MNGVGHATASTVRSPQQRRLSALAATGASSGLRTVVRAAVPGRRTAADLATAAEPVVRALFADTGLPPDARFALTVADGTVTLDLPAASADAPTAFAVLREITGADRGSAPVSHTAAAQWWDELSGATSAGPVREFWRARATGWAEPLPTVFGDDGRVGPAEAVLDGAVLAALRREPRPLAAWLLACWQVVLRRHTGREPVIGVATDLRRHDELAGCRGPLTAHLPVRAHVPLSAPFADHVEAVASDVDDGAQRAEWFDWARVLGDRAAAGHPLPVGFTATALPPPWDTPHGPARVTGIAAHGDAFALWLHCLDAGDRVELRIDHDDALAATLLTELVALLTDALAAPDRPAGELRLCPPPLAALLRAQGTGPTTSLPDGGIPGLVRATAAAWPDEQAARDGTRTATYAELVSRMDGLAATLRHNHSIGADDVVAVCLPAGVDLLVAVLAVQAAGGAYTCLDPDQPAARLAALANEAAAQLVIADDGTEPPVHGLPVVPAGTSNAAGAPAPAPLDALACVLHTVDADSMPTGVQLTHRGLLTHLTGSGDDWTRPVYTLVTVPATAVHTLPALYLPLLSGGRVTFGAPDPAALADELATGRYDLVCATPHRLRTLHAELAARATAGAPTPPRTGAVVVGGGPVPTALARDWAAVAPGATLFTHHGPAETTGTGTHGRVLAGPERTVPLGAPVANTTVRVLDGALLPCPPGMTGDLYLGGAGLARGYSGRPGATAARFVPDLDGPPGARLYRTGTRARWLAGGRVAVIDDTAEVEIHGHQVHPAEVAAVLTDHPGVAEAVVTARYDEDGAATLVCHAVAAADKVPTAALRAHAEARLPAYLVPAAVCWLDALPLGPDGGVDLAVLPAPEDGEEQDVAYMAPRTETEQMLAEVWAEALGRARVGVHDNFYAIGGDSIISILVAARAAKRGLKVALRDFFTHQTIAAMAPFAEPLAVRALPDDAPPGLTPVQHWFFDQDLPHPGHWNQGWLLTVDGEVDTFALGQAVAAVVRHHRGLGTTFPPGQAGAHPVHGVVDPTAAFHHVPLSPDTWADDLAAALGQLQEADLSTGPLLRVALFDGGPGLRRLALVGHHLVIDTVSWQIVFDDLDTAYRQVRAGRTVALPAPSTAPDRWGGLLTGAVDVAARDMDHWLAQSPPDLPPLPVDRAAPPPTWRDLRAVEVVLDAPRTRHLLRALATDVRVDHVLTTAVALAVTGWTGQPHLHLTVEGQGRDGHDLVPGVELHRSVGWFTAMAPLLLWLPGTGPLETLRSVRDQLLAVPTDGLSYGVLRHLDPERGGRLAALPVPQVSVNYVGHTGGRVRPDPAAGGLRLRQAPEPLPALLHPGSPTDWLWVVNAVVREARLHIGVDYSAAHYERATAIRLAEDVLGRMTELVDTWVAAGGLAVQAADLGFRDADRELLESALGLAVARAPRRPGSSAGTGAP